MIRKLNPREEEIMQVLWNLKKAFVPEIIENLSDSSAHYNTVSSIVRKLEKEGYIGHTSKGRSHKYYPIARKKAYRAALFTHLYENYFGSKKKFIQYTCEQLNLTKSQAQKLI